eukprot:scaffold177435_cov21-Tisochrysis_lutea.AAC.2
MPTLTCCQTFASAHTRAGVGTLCRKALEIFVMLSDPRQRITLAELMNHPWGTLNGKFPLKSTRALKPGETQEQHSGVQAEGTFAQVGGITKGLHRGYSTRPTARCPGWLGLVGACEVKEGFTWLFLPTRAAFHRDRNTVQQLGGGAFLNFCKFALVCSFILAPCVCSWGELEASSILATAATATVLNLLWTGYVVLFMDAM